MCTPHTGPHDRRMTSRDHTGVVGNPGEVGASAMSGTTRIPLTRLARLADELDPTRPTLVYCAGRYRSVIAASRLSVNGFVDVSDLLGGYAWWAGAADPNRSPTADDAGPSSPSHAA